MTVRRMLPLLLINIVVSAAVVLTVLTWWERRNLDETASPKPTVTLIALRPTAVATTVIPAEAEEVALSTPETEAQIYSVQPGDTLGNISRRFDVPMNDIIVANNIENPDLLEIDQQLIIPVEGLSAVEAEPTESPTPELFPSPIPTFSPADGEALLEIGAVSGIGDLTVESVSIVNNGSRPINLAGWQLRDADGHVYTFGQVTVFGEGAGIDLHTSSGQDDPIHLYWGLEEAVWLQGETVTLTDSEGTVRADGIAAAADE